MKNSFILLLALVSSSAFAQITSTDGTFNSGSSLTNTSLRTGATVRLTALASNGFIGINTASPTSFLDINGSLRIRSIPTSTSLTQMLVMDGSGNIFNRTLFPYVASANHIGLGQGSLISNTSGVWNVGLGTSTLAYNTSGQANTALGHEALFSNSTGSQNVAVGFQSLFNTTYGYNTAVGYKAGYQNTGAFITAIGYQALYSNNFGGGVNTAVGYQSMFTTSSGMWNTALGSSSMYFNTSGSYNVAVGESALFYNTGGNQNTACGNMALAYSSSDYNTAVGSSSLGANTTGFGNTAVGASALANNDTGNGNSAFGNGAGPNTSNLYNSTAIGYGVITTADHQVRIGNGSVTSIGGQVPWSTLSDGRFKRNIQENVAGLSFIRRLRPVSYEVDIAAQNKFLGVPDSVMSRFPGMKKISDRQTGFVAQEVEKIVQETGAIFTGVDAPANDKSHYSIRYSDFVVPLVKAVQELSTMVEGQQKEIEALKAALGDKGVVGENVDNNSKARLHDSNPNPFSTSTTIALTVPENTGSADIMIYNLEGKQLKRIPVTGRGESKVSVNANELAAGMYLYSLIVDGKIIDTKRMILTR